MAGNLPSLVVCSYCTAYHAMHIPQNKDIYRRATRVGTYEVCVAAHIALRMLSRRCPPLLQQDKCMLISITANKHAVLAGCSAFWPDTAYFLHKKGRHVAPLSGPSVYFLILCTYEGKARIL